MKVKTLQNLIFSPFHTSRIMHSFFTGVQSVQPSGISYEVFPVILPIIYNEFLCNQLSKLRVTSKFQSTFNKTEIRLQLIDFQNKVIQYEAVSKHALIMLGSLTEINLSKKIIVTEPLNPTLETDDVLQNIYKAAFNFGRLIAKENNLTIFLNLGLKAL